MNEYNIVCPNCKEENTLTIKMSYIAPLDVDQHGNVHVGYSDDKPYDDGIADCYNCGFEYPEKEWDKLKQKEAKQHLKYCNLCETDQYHIGNECLHCGDLG